MPRKVYFKGSGLITALGGDISAVLKAADNYSKPSIVNIEQSEGLLEVPYFTIKQPSVSVGANRVYEIIDSVVQQALDDSQLSEKQTHKMGLFVGSTSFDMFRCEESIKSSARKDKDIDKHIPPFSRLSSYVQQRFSLAGPVFSFNTACTSSANALIYAAEFIRRGDISHALVLGLEFYNEVTALGFSSLALLSTQGMRPFEKNRDGLYLGEGCGALVLSADTNENDNFAFIAGENIGDNFSITASDPSGETVKKVIEGALEKAQLEKSAINIIKTHGTASLSNDDAESAGLSKVFEGDIPPIVALKPLIGHTLGACGISELVLFYNALRQKKLLTYPCQISPEFPLRLATVNDIPEHGNYLLNYFGFGGNSTAIVIGNG